MDNFTKMESLPQLNAGSARTRIHRAKERACITFHVISTSGNNIVVPSFAVSVVLQLILKYRDLVYTVNFYSYWEIMAADQRIMRETSLDLASENLFVRREEKLKKV